jgi:hypothetical protein
VVHLVPAPGALAGSGATYTGSGTADQFYRSMSLGGPYDATLFPMAVTCTLGANSAVRMFSWVETE